eukprot:92766_1
MSYTIQFKKPKKNTSHHGYWYRSCTIPEDGPYEHNKKWCIDVNYFNMGETYSQPLTNILPVSKDIHEHIQYHYVYYRKKFIKWWVSQCQKIDKRHCIPLNSIIFVDSINKYLLITWQIPDYALWYWSHDTCNYLKVVAIAGGKEINLDTHQYNQSDTEWHLFDDVYYVSLLDDVQIVCRSESTPSLYCLLQIIQHVKFCLFQLYAKTTYIRSMANMGIGRLGFLRWMSRSVCVCHKSIAIAYVIYFWSWVYSNHQKYHQMEICV